MTRRDFSAFAGASAMLAGAGLKSAAAEDQPSLNSLAMAKGIRFGTAMSAAQLGDPNYVELVRRECGVIVAENEHKWYALHQEADQWTFGPADALTDFAEKEGLAMRGHTLLWHHPRWLPEWVNKTEFTKASDAERMLSRYIGAVAGRYNPFLHSWDVVNETIDENSGELRETSFSRAMGPEVIDYCFHRAREVAPTAKLAYNDYMSWEGASGAHRKGVLKLLERLKKNNAPIDALGVQSHSNYEMPDSFTTQKRREWRSFMDEVEDLGFEIYITEFDVNDTQLAPGIARRDRLIADYTRAYLDIMLSYEGLKEVLVWGLVDKYSWLQSFLPRTDGVAKRPTVFDGNYKAKTMRAAIAESLKAAAPRAPLSRVAR